MTNLDGDLESSISQGFNDLEWMTSPSDDYFDQLWIRVGEYSDPGLGVIIEVIVLEFSYGEEGDWEIEEYKEGYDGDELDYDPFKNRDKKNV